jgi:hypothetical protein
MHWFWENPEKKERGYCSAAVSRTQHMMWAREWEEHARHDPENRSLRGSEQPGRIEQAARPRGPIGYTFEVVVGIAVWSAIILAVVVSLL